MDNKIASFISFTNSNAQNAESYLRISDGDLEQAVQLFFDTGGASIDVPESAASTSSANRVSHSTGTSRADAIALEEDIEMLDDDSDYRAAVQASRHSSGTPPLRGNPVPVRGAATNFGHMDDDEAIARRLQEQFYSDAGGFGGEINGVRAPIARTTETLVGPEDDYIGAMSSQMRTRRNGMFTHCHCLLFL